MFLNNKFLIFFKELFLFKNFIIQNVKRNINHRYKNSIIGILWLLLTPLSQIIIYTVIFTTVIKIDNSKIFNSNDNNIFNYSIYICSGLVFWMLTQEILTKSLIMFVNYSDQLKKIKLPIQSVTLIIVIEAIINVLIFLFILSLFLIIINKINLFNFFWIIPLIFINSMFVLSIGIILGVIFIINKDIVHILNIVQQLIFWSVPIVYTIDILPKYKFIEIIYLLNPFFHFVDLYHKIIFTGLGFEFKLFILFLLSLILLILSFIFLINNKSFILDNL